MGNSQGKPVIFTDEVNLNHFRLLRVVGKGAFGKVRIVERKDTGLTFALKYIRKDEIVRSESVRNIIRERRMLEHLNHPFLCNLRYSFQDMEYLYLVQDLMNGGDLRFHISRKTMTEDAVRFWMAELACSLRYIHKQGIVHRDLKPDNVLLDSEGHVHLADFNVASEFRKEKKLHSKSGTLAYLAPEVYGGHGYLSEVDWWSLGVTFYECIYNKRPFESHHHDKLEKEIVAANPKYPVTQPPVSMPCYHAISSLLEKDRSKRIGAVSFESFTDSPFFKVLDFDLLERKKIPPIFVPSSEKTNFDATYDLEELLLEEAPLEARARRQKPRAQLKEDASEKEVRDDELHRMIEKYFEPFDYTHAAFDPATLPATEAPPGSGEAHASKSRKSSADDATSHSQTGTRNRSASPHGSPPLATGNEVQYFPAPSASPQQLVQQPPAQQTVESMGGHKLTKARTNNSGSADAAASLLSHESKQQQPHPQHPSSAGRARGATRSTSKGGGVQMVLSETGSWAELQDKSATMPAEAKTGIPLKKGEKPNGMLGFLSRKGGRARSPKPREPGVLGKEGARVVISSGR